jgi:hypothetical protein
MWWKARDRTRSGCRPVTKPDENAEAVATYTPRDREDAPAAPRQDALEQYETWNADEPQPTVWIDGVTVTVSRVRELAWNLSDMIPNRMISVFGAFDDRPLGFTYASAARWLRSIRFDRC